VAKRKGRISYGVKDVDRVLYWRKDGDTKVFGPDFGTSIRYLAGVSNHLSFVQELLDAEEVIY